MTNKNIANALGRIKQHELAAIRNGKDLARLLIAAGADESEVQELVEMQ